MSSISPQFLEEIICYLRRLDLLTAEEASQAQEASSLPEQVRAVVDVLAGKGSYASRSLQTFIESTNSQLYLHITVYGRQPTLDPRGVSAHTSGPWALAGAPQEAHRAGQCLAARSEGPSSRPLAALSGAATASSGAGNSGMAGGGGRLGTLTPSLGGCPNFRPSLQPSCRERFPWFPSRLEGSSPGWCLL